MEDGTSFALTLALVTALNEDGVLPVERFIETVRRHALQLRAAGATKLADELLETASAIALRLQRQP